MNSDTSRKTAQDVKFYAQGTGHYSARRCDERKGAFLCGAPVGSAKGGAALCASCRAKRDAA